MAAKLQNVLYVAVIRVDGQCVVASFGQPNYESLVDKVVNAPAFRSKVGTGQRIREFKNVTIICFFFFPSLPLLS